METVTIKQGELKGTLCEAFETEYIAFKGIPYAKPPIGRLRFKAPEPPEPWTGVWDASQHGPVCPQYNERMDCLETGNEDCLYINVYTKSLTPSHCLPVLVWIHGGGFYTGSSNSDFYGPEFFMAHNVILVTFNYRLGVLGFLCLDNEEVPGNAGMKDQVMALRWVKNNIAAFGGDRNNITIFGCSAGAASVSYHLISKMSEGLFNKVICQSGVCLNEWSLNIYPQKRAFQLGRLLNKDTNDPVELLEFLRNVSVCSLVNVQLPKLDVEHIDLTDNVFFGPVIEKSDLKVEKFIAESPTESLRKGVIANVPVIVGYTSAEGIETARKLNELLEYLGEIGSIVPREIKLNVSQEKLMIIDSKIRGKYFRNKKISTEILQDLSDLQTYSLFAYNIYRFASYCKMRISSPVYLYKFTAETERNYTKSHYNMNNLIGVCHADDLPYFFNVTSLDIPLTDKSTQVIKNIVNLWTTFALTGKPTESCLVEWEPYSDNARNCYIIGESFECVLDPDAEHIDFWENIYVDALGDDWKLKCVCDSAEESINES